MRTPVARYIKQSSMDFYSNSEVNTPRARPADELVALRAKVAQLERRLRDEGRQRQSLQRQLARRQVFLTRLTQAVPAAVYFYNLVTGTEAFLNDHLAPALGYASADLRPLKPRVLDALLHPHDKAGLHQYYTNARLRCSPVGTNTQHEVRLRNAAGGWQRVKLQHTVFMCDAQGYATYLLGSTVVGPAGEAQASDLLVDMSHEIKTPLHSIIGLARLLRKDPTAPAHLDALLANAENLLAIATSALQAGGPEESVFDVAATVQQAVQAMAFAAQAKGLALHLALPTTPLPDVVGAANRLLQLVVNLLGNAIKFTESGHITVTLGATEGPAGQVQLHLCVADTGIGIRADKVDQVFQRFVQAGAEVSQRYGGTGLGLAICKDLVERQGGRIWVESELGQGSRFHFTLCYPINYVGLLTPAASPLVPGLLQGLRVLLVEDNEIGVLLATTLLQTWQVTTEVATSGEQALALALAKPYDLILMDVHLPQLSGVEATNHLRSQAGPNQDTPIVALTAEAGVGNSDFFATAKFTGWLEKPYTEAHLYRALADYTGRNRKPASPTGSPYGFAGLGKLAHDVGFISKMQRLFVDTMPRRLAQLEALIDRQDWAAAQLLVHGLKTTYGSMQIEEAMYQIKKMEEVLKNNPTRIVLTNLFHFLRVSTARTAELFENQLGVAA